MGIAHEQKSQKKSNQAQIKCREFRNENFDPPGRVWDTEQPGIAKGMKIISFYPF